MEESDSMSEELAALKLPTPSANALWYAAGRAAATRQLRIWRWSTGVAAVFAVVVFVRSQTTSQWTRDRQSTALQVPDRPPAAYQERSSTVTGEPHSEEPSNAPARNATIVALGDAVMERGLAGLGSRRGGWGAGTGPVPTAADAAGLVDESN